MTVYSIEELQQIVIPTLAHVKSHIDPKWLLAQLGYKLTCDKKVEVVPQGKNTSSGTNLIGIVFWIEDASDLSIEVGGQMLHGSRMEFSYFNQVVPYQSAYLIPTNKHIGMYTFGMHSLDGQSNMGVCEKELKFNKKVHLVKIYPGNVTKL